MRTKRSFRTNGNRYRLPVVTFRSPTKKGYGSCQVLLHTHRQRFVGSQIFYIIYVLNLFGSILLHSFLDSAEKAALKKERTNKSHRSFGFPTHRSGDDSFFGRESVSKPPILQTNKQKKQFLFTKKKNLPFPPREKKKTSSGAVANIIQYLWCVRAGFVNLKRRARKGEKRRKKRPASPATQRKRDRERDDFSLVFFLSSHLKPMDLIITILPVVTKDLPISPRFTPYDF